jgi:hypothetical protein
MNIYEKLGIIILAAFFMLEFPESLKGAEVLFFILGALFFLGGKAIEEVFSILNK